MDLSPETATILQKRLAQLPTEYVDALRGGFVENLSDLLAVRQELGPAERAAIENEVLLVFLAFEPLSDLKTNIKNVTSLDEETIDAIVADVQSAVPDWLLHLLAQINKQQEEAGFGTNTQDSGVDSPPTERGREPITFRPDSSEKETNGNDASAPQPITREELLSAVPPKRTMDSDIDALQRAPQDKSDAEDTGAVPSTEEARKYEGAKTDADEKIPGFSKPLTNKTDGSKDNPHHPA